MQIYNSPESARHSRKDVKFLAFIHFISRFASILDLCSSQEYNGCRINWSSSSPLSLHPSLDHRWNEVRPMIITYKSIFMAYRLFLRRTGDLGRCDVTLMNGEPAVMRYDAMPCDAAGPKYQITGVWTELLARAAPGRVARVSSRNSRKVAQA